ncbi:MAG: adenylosuccinate synthase [Patescibacteria group bacterium]
MSQTAVIGAQWGDEGKGKIVDYLGGEVNIRFAGGSNAGHTLKVDDDKYVIHAAPSGIIRSGTHNLIGRYVALDLEALIPELDIAHKHQSKVMVDMMARIVLPIHKQLDAAREQACGKDKIGTTNRGVSTCYEDFATRRGVVFSDMATSDSFVKALKYMGYYDERCALLRYYGVEPWSVDRLVEWTRSNNFSWLVSNFGGNTRRSLNASISLGRRVVFEGAQGVMLFLHSGTYPFATSCFGGPDGIQVCFGHVELDRILGVTKAYATRVGAGPFPTEMSREMTDLIRTKGNEFGSTTGRERRCGWLDLVALRYACRYAGLTELVVTKLDVLSGFDNLNVCIAYSEDELGPEIWSAEASYLSTVRPIYKNLAGWKEDITSCSRARDLPEAARQYLDFMSSQVGLPIKLVSVGPSRRQTIRYPF